MMSESLRRVHSLTDLGRNFCTALIWCWIVCTVDVISGRLNAGDVEVKLSSKETYVGLPIQLQIGITNASDYQEPTLPNVDGLDIRSAGAPTQSTQISIFNGRRVQKTSLILQYEITPLREGTFELPSFSVDVDGRSHTIEAMTFVVSKSETGDLLFAKIEGSQKEIFVGQALDLKLKIWIKPFQDRDRKITLSEGNMWQMISEKTQWGPFQEKLEELAAQNQRPGGDEVLREDARGKRRSYFLYEIDATIYPKRVGKIDGEEVRVIVSYPEKLGNSRSPLDGVLGSSPFSNSPLSQMMEDDFFSSAFGNRLTVTKVRPIVANAEVEEIRVLPVPDEGKPADYLGAIGRYQIEVEASPTQVKAGDPISLRIGIRGTGPMEFVQAPPLSEFSTITDDFKVSSQPLAGFVRGDTKYFQTEIRPKREGIGEIPGIPFSFFDPDSREYKTVMSQPISIDVGKADILELDSIVDQRPNRLNDNTASSKTTPSTLTPWAHSSFQNDNSLDVLKTMGPIKRNALLWWALGLPPTLFSLLLIGKGVDRWLGESWRRRNATKNCLANLGRCDEPDQVIAELQHWLMTRLLLNHSSLDHSIGALRILGIYEGAANLESLVGRLSRLPKGRMDQNEGNELRNHACQIVRDLEQAIRSSTSATVRSADRSSSSSSSKTTSNRFGRHLSCFLALLISAWNGPSGLSQSETSSPQVPSIASSSIESLHSNGSVALEIAPEQRVVLFEEANHLYAMGLESERIDSGSIPVEFSRAAEKYQVLVDSGVTNAKLYFNLANAYLKSGQLGRALANYERAERYGLETMALLKNHSIALSKVEENSLESAASLGWFGWIRTYVYSALWRSSNAIRMVMGSQGFAFLISILSVCFWGPLSWFAWKGRFPRRTAWLIPCFLWLLLSSLALVQLVNEREPSISFSTVEVMELHESDDENSNVLAKLERFDGRRLKVLSDLGAWVRVEAPNGMSGWVRSDQVARVD